MRKMFACLPLGAALFCLTGCSPAGDQPAGISMIYAAAAVLSLLVLVGYSVSVRKKDGLFVLLFSSVLIVNTGYYLLSVSRDLSQALWANRVAYLGSVFLPAIMLLIILHATALRYPKWLPVLLTGIGAVVYLIAASPGILPIYYKEVSFVVIDGVSGLQKVYGPLHSLYGVYLLVYFLAMVAAIVHAAVKKKLESTGHAAILAIAVFVNMGVWFIEQLVKLDFEFLAVSYIISELFLLGLHLVMSEQQRLRMLVRETEQSGSASVPEVTPTAESSDCAEVVDERYVRYLAGVKALTQTEVAIYDAYVARKTTKEIMSIMNIKENTLKFHNKNIYNKLGVSSRKELQEIHGLLYAECER